MAIEYAVELLKKLIEVPTVNPPGKCYREMAELLKSEMESMGLGMEVAEVLEGYGVPGRVLPIRSPAQGAPEAHSARKDW